MRLALAAAAAAALVSGVLAGSALPTQAAGPVPSARHVHRTVVRPVDSHGDAVSGWTVDREKGKVSCSGPSAAAVDDDIVECYPTAMYLPACWKSRHHTVLCLRNARMHQLARIRYSGSIKHVTAPKRATPVDFTTTDKEFCMIRVGGAWGQVPTHPNWVGFDSCSDGSVYGPPSGDGIHRGPHGWTVHVWVTETKQKVVTRQVRKAWYVGTAA